MLEALYLIRVNVYHKEEGQDTSYDYENIAARLSTLTLPDWERVVQVREPDQRVQFYVRTEDETIVGLLVLVGNPRRICLHQYRRPPRHSPGWAHWPQVRHRAFGQH